MQPPHLEPFARHLHVERRGAERAGRVHLAVSRFGGDAGQLEPLARYRELRVDHPGAEIDRALALGERTTLRGASKKRELREVRRVHLGLKREQERALLRREPAA